jgi:hypothetical protein
MSYVLLVATYLNCELHRTTAQVYQPEHLTSTTQQIYIHSQEVLWHYLWSASLWRHTPWWRAEPCLFMGVGGMGNMSVSRPRSTPTTGTLTTRALASSLVSRAHTVP